MASIYDDLKGAASNIASSAANSFLKTSDAMFDGINGVPYQNKQPTVDATNILDREWGKIAFVIPDKDIADPDDIVNRYWSVADAMYTDTRLGCSIGINPAPQFTRHADIRVPGRLKRNKVSFANASGNFGIGRAYAENHEIPAQKIFLRFGVPQFNSLTTFLLRAFDREQMIYARTGRAPTAFYTLGKAVGTVIPLLAFPAFTVTVMAGKALSWLFSRPTSKFFTIKPTMHSYWSTVNQLVNNHAVNVGIFKKVLAEEAHQREGTPYKLDDEQIKKLSAMMPDIFNGHEFFDIYALANKAQRLANQIFMDDFAALKEGEETAMLGYLKRELTGDGTHTTYITDKNGNASLGAILNEAFMFGWYGTDGKELKQELDARVDKDSKDAKEIKDEKHFEQMLKYADAEFRDGSQFAVFRVDHTGSVQESFGNTVGESDLGQKLNGISSQFREARFSFADGNILGGAIGDMIQGVTNAAVNFAAGTLDGITLGFSGLIPGLGGSGYIDIPKHWQSSSATLPRMSYTIDLVSPYGNPFSEMISIWIPFYMLLAGVLPKSTGKQSYTAPYYCQCYDRGRAQTRTGMIEQLSITRGITNLPFNREGRALGVQMSFTIVDLSTIMHMPMSSGKLTETDMTLDEDNIAADYLNVLAGMDVYSQIYPFTQAQLKLTKKLTQLKGKFYSPAFHTAFFTNNIMPDVARNVIEGLVRGNAGAEGPLR